MLARRRLGETQAQAAARWGVTYHVYSRWETGDAEDEAPSVAVGRLQPYERALVYRRQAGTTQREVAAFLRVCVYTLRRMEQGRIDCSPLLEYWEC